MGTVHATTESDEVTTEDTEEKGEKATGCQSPEILRVPGLSSREKGIEGSDWLVIAHL